MAPALFTLYLLVYGFAFWFGLYLLARDWRKLVLRFAGLGLLAYALSLGASLLADYARTLDEGVTLLHLRSAFLLLPLVFWFGAAVHLFPETHALRLRLERPMGRGLLPLAAVVFAFLVFASGLEAFIQGMALLLVGLLLVWVLLAVWQALRAGAPRRPLAVFGGATIFFALGIVLLLLSAEVLLASLIVPAIGFDLALLGLAVAALDALEEGEQFSLDFFRSLSLSAFFALILGGQVALAALLSGGLTFPLLLLMMFVIATAIALQVFSEAIQSSADRLVFARFRRLRQARSELRTAASALSRQNLALDPDMLDEAEFARLTRRALSHFGSLQHLAASPLTRLKIIDTRLAARGRDGGTLERAAELKALLAESITRLKPRSEASFGTTDEWRYYNVLYFPYVLGLKPYARSQNDGDLNPTARAALEWFQTSVPERTLYNWQNAAAKLIARDLRERAASEKA